MERPIGVAAQNPRRSHIWNLPNLITLFRIGTIPFVVLFLFFPGAPASFLAALFFTAASLTDLLDGYIARQQKSETPFGKLLDPLADKLLINSAFIMLIPLGRVPAWVVVLIVGREVAVTGLRGIASLEGLAIAASKWGKAKMIFQAIASCSFHQPSSFLFCSQFLSSFFVSGSSLEGSFSKRGVPGSGIKVCAWILAAFSRIMVSIIFRESFRSSSVSPGKPKTKST